MTGSFVLDYILLTCLLSCGVFQAAAACGGFRGLQFFESRTFSIIFGLTVFTGAFVWFFLSQSRNVPDTGLGLNGNEQFGYFFAGSGLGLALTLAVSSLLRLPAIAVNHENCYQSRVENEREQDEVDHSIGSP